MENSPSIKSIAFTYGSLLAAYSILFLVFAYVFNIDQQNWIAGVINSLVSVIIFVLAVKAFKKKNNNYLSIKEAIKVGLATALISGLIAGLYSYFHYSFIFPEFIENIREQSYLEMSKQGMGDAQMEQAMEINEMFTSPWFFTLITIVSSLFFGFLISLIAGAIMKKENPALG